VTFKDLQRLVQSESGPNDNQSKLLSKLRGKEFWFWDQTKHGQKHRAHKSACCFNHIIGLPAKDGAEKPIFDYERMLYDALLKPAYLNSKPTNPSTMPNTIAHPFKVKHLFVKKATGLGVTEFMLRFMLGFVYAMTTIKAGHLSRGIR
jgi:hypothetical protein